MLVHGFGGAKEDFADHVPELARDHTVVVFDHRGHGESDKPDDLAAYSFDRLVADTLAVADAVGLDRFRLLGHSMGGMVARRVVLQHPERVEALILMDTAPGPIELRSRADGVRRADGAERGQGRAESAARRDRPAQHARVRAGARRAARVTRSSRTASGPTCRR